MLRIALAFVLSTLPTAFLGAPRESERAALPTALFDIRGLGRTTLDELQTNIEARGWWAELEDHLLVAMPAPELKALAQSLPLQQELGLHQTDDFALQGRGCAISREHELPHLAMAGRFALVLAPKSFAPPRWSLEWRPLEPNSIIASHSDNVARVPMKGSNSLAAQLASAVDANRWFADVSWLASYNRSSYDPALVNARDWIGSQFANLGLQVSYPSFTFISTTSSNVLGVYPGTTLSDEWILVGGHYDSRNTSITSFSPTPGAEDNASGCAGVIELARVLTTVRPRRRVLFMCYAGEEQGLYGSIAHVNGLQASSDLSRLKLALIMDMIGFSADADLDVLLESNGSTANQAVIAQFAAAAASHSSSLRVLTSNNPFGSDHVPYINAGVPSLLTIENDWNVYGHYHKATDLPANMSNALAMGGGILKMNAAALAFYLGGVEPGGNIFANGFE
jgi:hypothetical protein